MVRVRPHTAGTRTDVRLSLQAASEGREANRRARVLATATFGFTVFFAVWVMFAIVGIPLRKEFGLGDGEFALLAAIPIFTGSILRVPLGILADRLGGRRVFTALLLVTAIPTYLVSRADGYAELLVLAFFVGFAGTSFAVGIAWVSAWYPPNRQGFALGMFGAGNVGASITKLAAPSLVTLVAAGGVAGGVIPGGWRLVPCTYAILLVLTAAVLMLFAPTPDHRPAHGRTLAEVSRPLKVLRVWRFGLYYIVVFGAYVALSLWLPKYYVDVYGLTLRDAGFLTALFIFPASLLRPVGGWLSDRLGARPVTYTAFIVMCLALAWLSFPAGIVLFTALVVVIGVTMGIGKASVYKYIADYFPRDVGAVGGLVGAVGGLGGFALPLLFAWAQGDGAGKRPENTFLVVLVASIASLLWLHVIVVKMRRDERRRLLAGVRAGEAA
jgi:NNP family nitrate/nitrite transporter-like MFS transporter